MHDILDLDRYPLDRPGTAAWDDMVTTARRALKAEGMFNLDGLMRPAAVEADVAHVSPRLATEAYTHARRHNIYFRKEIPGLPPDHPALAMVETSNRTLCGDQMGGTNVGRLYDWPPFAAFLAAVMERPALYTMDDPLARLNGMGYDEGMGLNWHFDRSEFTITLLLQAPEAGSVFEYRSDLRTEDDPNYEGVARLLRGEDPARRAIILTPGTLNVFLGRNTAHRVTPAEGPRPRIVAVLCYYDRPGVRFTPEEQRGFYGRTVEAV